MYIENLGPEISREERLLNKCCWDHWEASGKKDNFELRFFMSFYFVTLGIFAKYVFHGGILLASFCLQDKA